MIILGCVWSLFEGKLFLHQPKLIMRLSLYVGLTTPIVTSAQNILDSRDENFYSQEILDAKEKINYESLIGIVEEQTMQVSSLTLNVQLTLEFI